MDAGTARLDIHMNVEDVIASAYDRLAPSNAAWADAVEPPLREQYLERLPPQRSARRRVLEIGCGTGKPVAAQLAETCDVVGIDISPEMIRLASIAVPTATFRVASATTIDFPDNYFDGVVAFYSLIHLPRQHHARLFRNVYRWLAPGGRFIASIGAHDWEGDDPDWLGSGRMHWSFFGAETNLGLLAEAGFTIQDSEVHRQTEPGGHEVEFLWVVASR